VPRVQMRRWQKQNFILDIVGRQSSDSGWKHATGWKI